MRKIYRTGYLDWEETELFKKMLDTQTLPELVIIETVEES